MKEKVYVISLGGSRIIPEDVDETFLKGFKKLLLSDKKHRFVVVTGGGKTARKYIAASKELNESKKEQSKIGIAITRFHAKFMMTYFGEPANEDLPLTITKVKNLLRKNKVVFCGALKEQKEQTTDATAARVAAHMKCPFINITNVAGLYTKNPKKYKDATLITSISWKEFYTIAQKITFKAGQNFVLDQKAAKIIMQKKVPTYITGSLKDIKKILKGKTFKGTTISG